MFSDESENYNMLFGAYKKIKSYYHYNKNFLFMREKIAVFENDNKKMNSILNHLAKILTNPSRYNRDIRTWVDSISYYVLPKTFTEDKSIEDRFVTSSLPSKSVTKVNFFIDMPMELHLLETVWTLFIAKIVNDNNVVQGCSYGNAIDDKVLFDNTIDDLKGSIRFKKNRLFKIYFPQYCDWKNNAINEVDKNKKDKNTVLVSLDIKSFFYSVCWKFEMLDRIIQDDRLDGLKQLTSIIKKIFEQYTKILSGVRVLAQKVNNKENVLPIGLFSSMLIANIYMSAFDKEMNGNKNVLYYGRYVDDVLLLLNVSQTGFTADDTGLEKLLVKDNNILLKAADNNFIINGYDNLIIQKDKLKVIFFECGKCNGLIAQLRKTKIIPSQMNIVPNSDIKMTDFEEAAYAIHNFTNETKIRDLGQLEIDRFKLSSHMSELVRSSRYRRENMDSPEEKQLRQQEIDKVTSFFVGSNAIEFNSNWINALYFTMLSSSGRKTKWYQLEDGIREAIRRIKISRLEDICKGKTQGIKSKMKKDLYHMFDICVATALAINPKFSNKEKKEILELRYLIRNANLFNHYLVSFPLMNYSEKIDGDVDFSNMSLSDLNKEYFEVHSSRKMELSPRFINFDELFQYYFIRSIVFGTSGMVSEQIIDNIRNTFLEVNDINPLWANPLAISIQDDNGIIAGYKFQKISLYNKKRNLNRIKIAVANIKLDIDKCCMGLNGTPVIRNRLDFISFLSASYKNQKDKVDYLVFPEFYLPLSWMQDVLSFSRKTGITVISGIQYICRNNMAHNVIGVFARVKSGRYNSSCILVREKNNYAPLEKQLLATEGYSVIDKDTPVYTCIDDGSVRFGLLLCYEFTDICARGLFKDKADILFIPENNSDTTYFSNIVETMTRDVHAFMVQSNTSNYGDSRISGPYSRDQRNVVQIKGGDNDGLIIGTINIQEVINYRALKRKESEDEIQKILNMDKSQRMKTKNQLKGKHDLKISKTSARTFF